VKGWWSLISAYVIYVYNKYPSSLSLIFQAVFGGSGFVNYYKFYSIAMYRILRRTNPSFEIWGENEKAGTAS